MTSCRSLGYGQPEEYDEYESVNEERDSYADFSAKEGKFFTLQRITDFCSLLTYPKNTFTSIMEILGINCRIKKYVF